MATARIRPFAVGEYPIGQRHATAAHFVLKNPVQVTGEKVEVIRRRHFAGRTDAEISRFPRISAFTGRNYWHFARRSH